MNPSNRDLGAVIVAGGVALIVALGCGAQGMMVKGDVGAEKTENTQVKDYSKLSADKETIERSTAVSNVTRITETEGFEEAPAMSQDGKMLAFGYYELKGETGYQGDIWIKDLVKGTLIKKTSVETDETNPTFSKNDEFIIFQTGTYGQQTITKIKTVGSGGVVRLTSGPAELMPNTNRANNKVAFTSMSGIESGLICTVDERGGEFTQLREGIRPRYSFDGTRIVYESMISRSKVISNIWTATADGDDQTQVTRGDFGDFHPSFSQDGTKIVFTSNRTLHGKKADYNIWMVNSDGTGLTQLTSNKSGDLYPIFGNDNKTVYFTSNRGKQWDIWRMNVSE